MWVVERILGGEVTVLWCLGYIQRLIRRLVILSLIELLSIFNYPGKGVVMLSSS